MLHRNEKVNQERGRHGIQITGDLRQGKGEITVKGPEGTYQN